MTTYPGPAGDYYNAYQLAAEIVDEKFRLYVGKAEEMLQQVVSAMTDLSDYLATLTPSSVDIVFEEVPDISLDTWTGEKPPPPEIEFNPPPPPPEFDYEQLDIDDIPVPTMENVTLPAISITPGQLDYTSELLTALKEKLLNDVVSGDVGIDPDVETAIFERELERSLLVHTDNMDRIAAEWSKRGFTLPDGVLAKLFNEEEINYTNKRLDTSRDISIKSFELAQQNTQFSVTAGISLENKLMDFADACQRRIFEASKAYMEAEIALYSAQLNAYKIEADIYTAVVGARIAEVKAKTDAYVAQVNAYKASVEAEKARVEALADVYTAEMAGYKAEAEVYKALSEVQIKIFEGRISQALAQAQVDIKAREIEIKNLEVIAGITVEAMKAEGTIMAQVTAGLLGSVQAAAEVSGRGQTSTNTNYNYER